MNYEICLNCKKEYDADEQNEMCPHIPLFKNYPSYWKDLEFVKVVDVEQKAEQDTKPENNLSLNQKGK